MINQSLFTGCNTPFYQDFKCLVRPRTTKIEIKTIKKLNFDNKRHLGVFDVRSASQTCKLFNNTF